MKKLLFLIMLIPSIVIAVNNQYNPLIFNGFQDYDALTASTATYSSNSDTVDGQHAWQIIATSAGLTPTPDLTPYAIRSDVSSSTNTILTGVWSNESVRVGTATYALTGTTFTVANQIGIGKSPVFPLDVTGTGVAIANFSQSGVYDDLTDVKTANAATAPDTGITLASSEVNSLNAAWMAVDKSLTAGWVPTGNTGWWRYDFGSGNSQTITRYTIIATPVGLTTRAPVAWTIGVADSTTTLASVFVDTQTLQNGWTGLEKRTYTITIPTSGRYWQINISSCSGSANVELLEVTLEVAYAGGAKVTSSGMYIGQKSTDTFIASANGEVVITGDKSNSRGIVSGKKALLMRCTADAGGTASLLVENRSGVAGAQFTTNIDLVDFGFMATATAGSVRWENRSAFSYTKNPEFQFGVASNPSLCTSASGTNIRLGALSIGNTTFNQIKVWTGYGIEITTDTKLASVTVGGLAQVKYTGFGVGITTPTTAMIGSFYIEQVAPYDILIATSTSDCIYGWKRK